MKSPCDVENVSRNVGFGRYTSSDVLLAGDDLRVDGLLPLDGIGTDPKSSSGFDENGETVRKIDTFDFCERFFFDFIGGLIAGIGVASGPEDLWRVI